MTATVHPLAVRLTRYVPDDHRPHPRQHAFLWLNCFEALYGGAAGGGKSDALLMAALQYVDQAGYAALLLRKTFSDLALPGAIMDRSKQWLAGTDARWSELEKTWSFPRGGRLTFGFLQTTNDKYRYQGSEWDFVGFDEATQFDEDDYVYLASRIRKIEGNPIPSRLRAASNPGGRGHEWVKRRFVQRQPRPNDAEDTPERCAARRFIPAKLDDNPSLNQTAYREALSLLDPQTRLQLLNGDWDARQPGAWVYDAEEIAAALDLGRRLDSLNGSALPPAGGSVALGIDWGEHTSGLVIHPLEAGGIWVTDEIVEKSAVPSVAAHRMIDTALTRGYPVTSARFDAAGVQSMRQFMATAKERGMCEPGDPTKLTWQSVPFGKYKAETINYLRLLFARTGAGEATRVIAISPRCTELARQLRALQFKDDDAGAILKQDDHGPDALVAGVAPIAARHRATVDGLLRSAAA